MLLLVAYISVLLYSSQDTENKIMLVLQLFLVSPEHWWHIYDEIEEQKASSTLLFPLLWYHGDERLQFSIQMHRGFFSRQIRI